MIDGTAMPIVVSAIFVVRPGTTGITASAAPPSATLAPPRRPRAMRLDTPRASRRCEYQPAAMTTTTAAPAGNAPSRPIELGGRTSPLIRNAPCQDRPCVNPLCEPEPAHQQARIVGLSNN